MLATTLLDLNSKFHCCSEVRQPPRRRLRDLSPESRRQEEEMRLERKRKASREWRAKYSSKGVPLMRFPALFCFPI